MKFSRIFAISLLILTSACARNMNNNTYVDSSTSGTVIEGTIISARPVTIKSSDKLQDNGAGILGGGVVGGVAGNQFGGGRGNTAATVGGALAGAVIGSLIQDELSKQDGYEYLVKVSPEYLGDFKKKRSEISYRKGTDKKAGTDTIDTNFKSNIVSVVQGNEEVFAKGQKVYIVYSDDRPRLISTQ